MFKALIPSNRYVALAAWACVLAFIGLVWFAAPAPALEIPDSSQMSFTSQAGTLLNSSDTSADDTAFVKTLTGVAGKSVHLYSVDAICDTGTSSITVDDVTTEIFSLAVTNAQGRTTWNPPLTAGAGNNMVVTIATCGTSNAGTLIIQADQY